VKSVSKAGRLMIWQAMRDNEHPSVDMPRMKKVDGQFDEVIPIARHKKSVFGRSIAQVGFIIEAMPLDLVHTHDIEVQAPTDLRHRRATSSSSKKRIGLYASEGRGTAKGRSRRTRSGVHWCSRASRASMSSG
jgi:hypothetical protein